MAKNKMKQVAGLLGVQLDEPFYIFGWDKEYVITEDGLELLNECDLDEDGLQVPSFAFILNQLLTGKLVVSWKPKVGEIYYYPHFTRETGYAHEYWHNHPVDKLIQNNVGVYQDPIDAMRKSLEYRWITKEFYDKELAKYYAELLKDNKEI